MLRMFKLLPLAILALLVAFTVSCEGPAGADGVDGMDGAAGAAGADGADGADGAAGADGMDGADANEFCVDCHSADKWDLITGEYALSGHAAAGALGYAGGRGSCSRCHSSEGFAGFLLGYPGEDLTQKSALSCESCHGNHTTLEESEISAPMATMAAVKLIVDESTEVDLEGVSNLCGTCHNSRRNGSYYTDVDTLSDGTPILADSVYISSTHAGPHYSAQLNTLVGIGGYGATASTAHESVGCVGCHMGDATATAGGHTFAPNLANCTVACHSSVTDMAAFVTEKHDARKADMDAIATALAAAGALIDNGDGTFSLVKALVSEDVFQAFWNYRVMYQDHSYGVHNGPYYTSMIATAKAKLGI